MESISQSDRIYNLEHYVSKLVSRISVLPALGSINEYCNEFIFSGVGALKEHFVILQ